MLAARPGSLWAPLRPGGSPLGSLAPCRRDHGLRTQHGCRSAARPGLVITAALRGDPWKTLGVTQDADEKEIKRAHRRLVLRLHPDVRKARQGGAAGEDAQAEAAFLAVQEAYEIIMGRRRGKELDASADGNSWEFHDWYWRFTMSKKWGRRKGAKGPNPYASATPPPSGHWRSQLDGLKRKAASKRGAQHGRSGTAAGAQPGPEWPPAAARRGGGRAEAGKAQQSADAAGRAQQPEHGRPHAAAAGGGAHAQQGQQRQRERQQGQPQPAAASAAAAATDSPVGEPLSSSPRATSAKPAAQHGARGAPLHHVAAAGAAAAASTAEEEEPLLHQHAQPGMRHAEPLGNIRSVPLVHPLEEVSLPHAQGGLHHSDLLDQGHSAEHQEQPAHDAPPPLHHPPPHHSEQLLGLVGRVVGRVHRLHEESGGTLQNHIVRLVRHASQLGQHLQVQLVRLRVLSSLRQGDVAQRAQHAQSSELHVEFEAAVRLRLRHAASGHLYGGEPGDAAAAASASAAAAAGSPQQQHLHQAAAAGGAGAGAAAAAAADGSTSQGPEMDPEEYCRRSRRFVNDDRVRDRVSSQLAGLRRRASMRQEFE